MSAAKRREAAVRAAGVPARMLHTISVRDLLAANDLPPIEDDTLRMGDVLYVSGVR